MNAQSAKEGRTEEEEQGGNQTIRELKREIQTSNDKTQPAIYVSTFIFINEQNQGDDFFYFIPTDTRKRGQLPREQPGIRSNGTIKVHHIQTTTDE